RPSSAELLIIGSSRRSEWSMAELLNSDGSSIHPRRRSPRTSARVSGEDAPARVSGEDAPARVSGEDAPARVSGEDAPARVSGGDAPARGEKIRMRTAGIVDPT